MNSLPRVVWFLPSIIIVILCIVGPVGAFSGLLGPRPGFLLFVSALFVSLVSTLAFGTSLAFASVRRSGRRGTVLRAATIPLIAFTIFGLPTVVGLRHPINDVTTAAEDELEFAPRVVALRPPAPREGTLREQREFYPEVQPLMLTSTPQQAFERITIVAQSLPGWEIVQVHPNRLRLEALVTSRVFQFQDDVVIEVQPVNSGSQIDMRSRSRIGRTDFGANAKRIQEFFALIRGR